MTRTRVPINIDPKVRKALRDHLHAKYAGDGVGYSEFIRLAVLRDGGQAPDAVQPDTRRWTGDHEPSTEAGKGLADGEDDGLTALIVEIEEEARRLERAEVVDGLRTLGYGSLDAMQEQRGKLRTQGAAEMLDRVVGWIGGRK